MPSDRGDRTAGTRHVAFRADETGGAERSPDGQNAVRCGATAAGEPSRGFLQPGGLSESFEIWRAGAGSAADPGAGECAISALRADSSQYLHQLSHAVGRDAADESASASFVCGADL